MSLSKLVRRKLYSGATVTYNKRDHEMETACLACVALRCVILAQSVAIAP